jgi:hypothetical protein
LSILSRDPSRYGGVVDAGAGLGVAESVRRVLPWIVSLLELVALPSVRIASVRPSVVLLRRRGSELGSDCRLDFRDGKVCHSVVVRRDTSGLLLLLGLLSLLGLLVPRVRSDFSSPSSSRLEDLWRS